MRILDPRSLKPLDTAVLYLTIEEMRELRDCINAILADFVGRHEHVYSSDYQKELTICGYDPASTAGYGFDERSVRLITEDK